MKQNETSMNETILATFDAANVLRFQLKFPLCVIRNIWRCSVKSLIEKDELIAEIRARNERAMASLKMCNLTDTKVRNVLAIFGSARYALLCAREIREKRMCRPSRFKIGTYVRIRELLNGDAI